MKGFIQQPREYRVYTNEYKRQAPGLLKFLTE